MHPNGANKNMVDHAIFSKDGPNLSKPADTNTPRVIPKIYKLKKRKARGKPRFNIEIPKSGEVSNIAGINPIKALINAVKTRAVMISLIFIGAINRLVKFLLQISSKNNILKPILVLNKKSYRIAHERITPTAPL
tara:strand:+ start:243 stop:647 length:405 start_codon:yes stop_codon:yes gene_type:complete